MAQSRSGMDKRAGGTRMVVLLKLIKNISLWITIYNIQPIDSSTSSSSRKE